MFRRRRRDDADPAAEGSEAEYPADELAEQDEFPDETDEADEYEEYDDAESDDDETEDQEGNEIGEAADEPSGQPGARAGRDDLSDPVTWTRLRDSAVAEPVHARSAGPWDSSDSFPEAERVDLGSLLVPVRDGTDVQLAFSPEAGVALAVVAGESVLQLQAFAAPRSSGLWDKVRPEISAEVAKAGGTSQSQDGPFGPELLARVTPEPEGDVQLPPQPLRFLGADGPRWFLRGMISGPAATDASLARLLEDIFADVVVVRGDHAAAPETPLEIQLPDGARQVFAEQLEAQQPGMPNPFERGPEITESR